MSNIVNDLTGRRFGKLLVLEKLLPNKRGNYQFKCRCECGKIKIINGGNLQRSISCGCYRRTNISPKRKTKICSKCKLKKSMKEFVKNKTRKDKRSQYCKHCYSGINKKYSGKYKNRLADYMKHKRRSNINFRIADNLRRRINKALNNNTKKDHSIELLGCPIDQFKKYLENKFDSNMTWNNYGTYWNIDHIKPCASFDLSNPLQQKECFNFTNQRPLKITENQAKNSLFQGKRYTYVIR